MKMRYLLLCVAVGAAAGATMIITHHGPGIMAKHPAPTPESRNATRTQLLHQIATALSQYQTDHGKLPLRLPSSSVQICAGAGDICSQYHLADLSFLITGGYYLPTIPQDPLGGEGHRGSGFFVEALADGSLKLTAPEAEASKTIELRFIP
jgi:hypothetical protein